LILYANAISNFAAKVRLVIALKGIVCEERLPPDGYGPAAYRRIVPMGTIPALVYGDLVLSESETIAEYLEEIFRDPPLLPASPLARAQVRLLARFHDLYLEPPLRALFGHVSPASRDPEQVRAHGAAVQRRLTELEVFADANGPFLAGKLSLADCGFPATIVLAEAMLPTLGVAMARLSAWRGRIDLHPVAGPLTRAYRATANAWVAGKLDA
jgi:glutathione S-transferase